MLSDLVSISIDTQTTSISRAGFGIPLVLGYHTKFVERLRFYTSLADMVTDGFATTDGIYKAAAAVLAQDPHPPTIAVGRLTVASTMTVNLTPIVTDLVEFTVTIGDSDFTYTSDGSATAAEIVNGLVALINAGSEPVTASNAANVLHLVADVAGDYFECEIDYRYFERADVTLDTSDIAAQLAAISIEDDSWYALALVNQGADEIANAAEYIETVDKFAAFVSGDSDIFDGASTTDVAYVIKAANYARSAVIFSKKPGKFSASAWIGEELPNDPGSSTWKFKTLAGVPADTLTATQIAAIKAKKCNYYTTIAGVSITQEGVTGSGEFIDVTIFRDWLKVRMQERIFGIMVNRKKIPMTDTGIQLIEGAMKAQLEEGVTVGGLVAGTLQVVVPLASAVSVDNKAARILAPLTFQAELAGAVHKLVITGTVTA